MAESTSVGKKKSSRCGLRGKRNFEASTKSYKLKCEKTKDSETCETILSSASSFWSGTPSQISANKFNLPRVECIIISTDRFEVKTASISYVEDTLKTISSFSYEFSSRKWTFCLKHLRAVLDKLHQFKEQIYVTYPSQLLVSYLLEPKYRKVDDTDLKSIDQYILQNAFSFQKDGILFGISREGRCLIADDMGLGKTVQALGIAHYYQNDWPCLIVCPASVSYHWLMSIKKWLPSLPPDIAKIIKTEKDCLNFGATIQFYIVSYGIISRNPHILKKDFGVVIVDESHYIKNGDALRTSVIVDKLRKVHRAILLSGTPALSRPVELFTQINGIDPILFPNFNQYAARYCKTSTFKGYKKIYSGCKNAEELQLILQHTLMIRRLKKDVVSQLPSKIREVVLLDLDDLDLRMAGKLKTLEKNFKRHDISVEEKNKIMHKYFFMSAKCKLPWVLDFLEDFLENEKKSIIFAHHKIVITGISKFLSENDIDFICIDGSTTSLQRQKLCDKFQTDSSCTVAVLSICAASLGLTFTAAEQVIFAELFWNPSILIQAEDRAHRIGQRSSVLIKYLVAPDTIDHIIWPTIQNKMKVLSQVGLSLDSLDCFPSSANHTVHGHSQDFYDFVGNSSYDLPVPEKETTDFFDSDDDDILMAAMDIANI